MKEHTILIEMTLNQLYTSAVDAFPATTRRQYSTDELKVTAIKFVPQERALMIKTVVMNTHSGKEYDNVILVRDVEYVDEDGPGIITFTGSDGQEYHCRQIKTHTHHVQVQCNCLDFYWRFAQWDFNREALYGNPPEPYVKKTDRPDANPLRKPGICKHVMVSIEAIQQSNLMR